MSAGHLPVAVEDRDRRVESLAEWFSFMWPDGRYSASDYGFGTARFTLPDGLVADADAGDIGDGVVGPGGKKSHRDPEVASSAPSAWGTRHRSASEASAARAAGLPGRSSSDRRAGG